ncbi:MAG UNVERIFIED_CONTAM: hypothetical protein LVT10_10650 [Anaerolineae bacterium]
MPLKFTPEDFPEGTDERISRFYSDFGAVTGEGRVGYTTWTFWPADADVQLWQEIENVWYDELAVEDYLCQPPNAMGRSSCVWQRASAPSSVTEIRVGRAKSCPPHLNTENLPWHQPLRYIHGHQLTVRNTHLNPLGDAGYLFFHYSFLTS